MLERTPLGPVPRAPSTSRRAARGRTSSAGAQGSGAGSTRSSGRSSPSSRRRRERLRRGGERRAARPDPHRRGRGHLRPPHHPALRDRAGAAGRHARDADLPEAWNARVRDYLGIEVEDDAHGVLQDMHWAIGLVGYFPTYQLGNVISVQIWERGAPTSATSTSSSRAASSGRYASGCGARLPPRAQVRRRGDLRRITGARSTRSRTSSISKEVRLTASASSARGRSAASTRRTSRPSAT